MNSIQQILFKNQHFVGIDDLYFRGEGIVPQDAVTAHIRKGVKVSFDTYFNSFSLEKWLRYTNMSNFGLAVEATGDYEIELLHINENGIQNSLVKEKIKSTEKKSITLSYPKEITTGILSFNIITLSDVVINSITYIADASQNLRDLSMAIGFCTFKREEYITNNLEAIRTNLLNDPNTPLYNHLQVFVADNGQTLDASLYNNSPIHIFPNANYGGAGGFTRTIIESMIKQKGTFDYIILMDDDLVLDTHILERTYTFLSSLKPKYHNSMMGGAILSQQEPWLQVENGAFCDNHAERHKVHGMMDMRKLSNIIINQQEKGANYNGWFYCAIPASVAREDNLPLPIFIHYDDTDYGHRNSKYPLITMGGICIWHPNLIGKDPLWMSYYNQRNELIHHLWCNPEVSGETIWQNFEKVALRTLNSYRYDEVLLLCKGLEDFYKGPEYFKSQNPLQLHLDLIKYKYSRVSISSTKVFMQRIINKILRIMHSRVNKLYSYDKSDGTALVFCYDHDKEEICKQNLEQTHKTIFTQHDKIWKPWINTYKEITTYAYWQKYLELK